MELLFLIVLVALVAVFVSNGRLKARLTLLEQRVDGLVEPTGVEIVPAGAALPDGPAAARSATASDMVAEPERLAEAEAALASGDEARDRLPEAPRETLGGLFERLVAGRLLIWLGGIALVLAAIFLIRYSIEVGLITPAARMVGAGLFGLLLLGAGEWARAGRLADDPRIAQALVGAGIAVLYATIYGSHILYALIGSGTAFAGMAAVTVAALLLSLRHGVPTTVMGLVGGFLTPLLVGSQAQGAAP